MDAPAFEVFRDDHGIPHLRAASVEALAYAQGHTAARDRTWQVDLLRRRAEGRVADILGAPAVEWDRYARRVLVEATARTAYAGLSPESRAFVTAYVDGVNAGLAISGSAEHRALGATPGAWQPWTPLAVFLVQHVLFGSYPTKLWRRHVQRQLGDAGLDLFTPGALPAAGSNAFGVGGGRTRSGLPLIAGDPHRLFEAPNVYAQVRLACPEFDVVGFGFPGVPGIQHFAHAGSVAWAITNASADYQDLYVEELARDGDTVLAYGVPVTWHVETIEVRGEDPVEVEVLVTPRGPVVVGGPEHDESFSLRTPSWVGADLGFDTFLPLLRSRTTADVDAAMVGWVEPVNNAVIADTQGVVLHRVAGRVPVRPAANRLLPVRAADDWDGWVTALPRTPVEHDGLVVTANDRMDDSFDAISSDFSPPYRADRIRALLDGRTDLTVDDLAVVQTDTFSARAGVDLATDGGAYHVARDALVAEIAATEPMRRVDGRSPYGVVHDPWFHLPTRIASALDTSRIGPLGTGRPPRTYHPLHGLEQFGLDLPLVAELHRDVAVPVHGDSDTVCAMHAVPGSDLAVRGPVARYVWDLADRDDSRWVVPLGASGEPGPHHHDQLDLWASGRLAPVVTDWDRLTPEPPS